MPGQAVDPMEGQNPAADLPRLGGDEPERQRKIIHVMTVVSVRIRSLTSLLPCLRKPQARFVQLFRHSEPIGAIRLQVASHTAPYANREAIEGGVQFAWRRKLRARREV